MADTHTEIHSCLHYSFCGGYVSHHAGGPWVAMSERNTTVVISLEIDSIMPGLLTRFP